MLFRPPARSVARPDCHLAMKVWKSSWLAAPTTVIGVVSVFGFLKIDRKVLNFGSGLSTGDFSEPVVVGTFLIPLESSASALSSVPRYFTSSHATSWCFDVRG